MKKILALALSLCVLLGLMAGCGNTAGSAETTEAPEKFVTTTIVSGGTSDFVIVHDGSTNAVTLANAVSNAIYKEFGVLLKSVNAAAGENAREIVIGNCRALAEKTVGKLKNPCDFAVKVEENALILCGTNQVAYLYLQEYLTREVLVKTEDGVLQLDSDDNIFYSESALSDINYMEYLAQAGKDFQLADIFDWAIYENADTKLPYRIYIPFDYSPDNKYPLLVNLHGAGLRGDNNTKHLAFIDKTLRLPDVGSRRMGSSYAMCRLQSRR